MKGKAMIVLVVVATGCATTPKPLAPVATATRPPVFASNFQQELGQPSLRECLSALSVPFQVAGVYAAFPLDVFGFWLSSGSSPGDTPLTDSAIDHLMGLDVVYPSFKVEKDEGRISGSRGVVVLTDGTGGVLPVWLHLTNKRLLVDSMAGMQSIEIEAITNISPVRNRGRNWIQVAWGDGRTLIFRAKEKALTRDLEKLTRIGVG